MKLNTPELSQFMPSNPKPTPKERAVTFRLAPGLISFLTEESEATGMNKSDTFRKALILGLEKMRKERGAK